VLKQFIRGWQSDRHFATKIAKIANLKLIQRLDKDLSIELSKRSKAA
jgi:hypothetical protein